MIKKDQAQANNEWHTGAPPSHGWYLASITGCAGIYRWWDGKHWSEFAIKTDTAKGAAIYAQKKLSYSDAIKWQNRPSDWPERSLT